MNVLSRRSFSVVSKQLTRQAQIRVAVPRVSAASLNVASVRGAVFARNSVSATTLQATRSTLLVQQPRFFAANLLKQPEVADRILKVVKDFHRVGESVQVSENSHFIQDLGLDSLDEVELMLVVEDEFAIEIPDAEAEKIHSVTEAVKYILVRQTMMLKREKI
jgi:NADH dehydrogenase (ubiquinone) 1 alpha/beta subcomplex 1